MPQGSHAYLPAVDPLKLELSKYRPSAQEARRARRPRARNSRRRGPRGRASHRACRPSSSASGAAWSPGRRSMAACWNSSRRALAGSADPQCAPEAPSPGLQAALRASRCPPGRHPDSRSRSIPVVTRKVRPTERVHLGIVESDRAKAYYDIPAWDRGLCHAHLKRKLVAVIEQGGRLGHLAQLVRNEQKRLFGLDQARERGEMSQRRSWRS